MKVYNEIIFMIDIVSNQYNTKNPYEIKRLIKDIFDEEISIINIVSNLKNGNKYELRNHTLQLAEIFDNE